MDRMAALEDSRRRRPRAGSLGVVLSLVLSASAAIAAPPPAPAGAITKPIHLARSFSMRLSDGCRYDAAVRGDVTPARGASRGADLVVPNLVVNADLQCPDAATLRLTQRVNQGPLTRAELEDTLAQRGRLTSPTAPPGRSCIYSPEFDLSNAGLDLVSVSTACPLP